MNALVENDKERSNRLVEELSNRMQTSEKERDDALSNEARYDTGLISTERSQGWCPFVIANTYVYMHHPL